MTPSLCFSQIQHGSTVTPQSRKELESKGKPETPSSNPNLTREWLNYSGSLSRTKLSTVALWSRIELESKEKSRSPSVSPNFLAQNWSHKSESNTLRPTHIANTNIAQTSITNTRKTQTHRWAIAKDWTTCIPLIRILAMKRNAVIGMINTTYSKIQTKQHNPIASTQCPNPSTTQLLASSKE